MPETMSKLARRALMITALAGLPGGCVDLSTPGDDLGKLFVSITDESNAGVANVPVTLLRASDQLPWRSLRTSSAGTGEFGAADGGVLPQSYIVRVELQGLRMSLAQGETNDKPVTVQSGGTEQVTFRLVRDAIGI